MAGSLASCLLAMLALAGAAAQTTPEAVPRAAASPLVKGHWYHQAFEDPAGPSPATVEQWLNTSCRPASLSSLQMFASQVGHGGRWNLHVWCRADGAGDARYRVRLLTFPRAQFGAPLLELVNNPRVRVGPFFLGNPADGTKPDGDDGVLVVEKTR